LPVKDGLILQNNATSPKNQLFQRISGFTTVQCVTVLKLISALDRMVETLPLEKRITE